MDSAHTRRPPSISRWCSEPGPSRDRSAELEDLIRPRTGAEETVRAEVHRLLSPVPEDQSRVVHRRLARSPSIHDGIDQLGNLAATSSYGKERVDGESQETETVGESRTDVVMGGEDDVQVHSPTASMTSTSGRGSSDENEGLPYGTMHTEGVALTPSVRQAVSSTSPESRPDEVRHKGVMQQDSRKQLVKQDTFDMPDIEQPPITRRVSEERRVLFDWSERPKSKDFDTIVHWIRNPETETSYV